jgi:hypothetical protein
MRTRILMISSAAFMLMLGLLMTFAPQEVLAWGGSQARLFPVLVVQAAGALYLGFAMVNWTARGTAIGGIYSRPVALGNLVHFFVVAATLLRAVAAAHGSRVLWAAFVAYAVFAGWFGLLVFRGPSREPAR